MLATVCFILAAVFFALGFFRFTWGSPPRPAPDWLCGGLFWVVMGLWIVALLH